MIKDFTTACLWKPRVRKLGMKLKKGGLMRSIIVNLISTCRTIRGRERVLGSLKQKLRIGKTFKNNQQRKSMHQIYNIFILEHGLRRCKHSRLSHNSFKFVLRMTLFQLSQSITAHCSQHKISIRVIIFGQKKVQERLVTCAPMLVRLGRFLN